MFAIHDDKLFSGMCKWSNHCLHHCCLINVTLDTIFGIEDILISWFLIILAVSRNTAPAASAPKMGIF